MCEEKLGSQSFRYLCFSYFPPPFFHKYIFCFSYIILLVLIRSHDQGYFLIPMLPSFLSNIYLTQFVQLSYQSYFPMLLLCLNPTRLIRGLVQCCLLTQWQCIIKAFTDTFQGHYKNGTNGTHDYRAMSAIFLFWFLLLFFNMFIH